MNKNEIIYPQLDGIFVLNKPAGPASARCLKIFKQLGQKKIGHAGTLDPLASGVLLVLLGQATKLSSYLLENGKKIYSGTICLGVETDTWDSEGNIIEEHPVSNINSELIEQEIIKWQDMNEQEVPPYSAAKYNGQPLYKLARKGCCTPKKIKKISVLKACMLSFNMPLVHFRVECTSGTYIRSLAHSLGKRLGTGAHLKQLAREYSHPFGLDVSYAYADLEANPELLLSGLRSFAEALPSWPVIELSDIQANAIRNGRQIPLTGINAGKNALLCHNGKPLALGQKEAGQKYPVWSVARGLWA